ncbi:C2 domain-containing protein [Microsporum canis CBS 113480]|uniref:C2 domain-containing protein n=1 Tax=Arthroderma otae (strain ATCC MYA-4605 / CBS 113480) TaxID=554155 RepID=C5FTM5_ARTOC|nr:C2 domain-containing protein [Microsporum canis CBS 113480]EEQ33228.1 C2 domain-containing protein [Microsporum canis CBS 113480]
MSVSVSETTYMSSTKRHSVGGIRRVDSPSDNVKRHSRNISAARRRRVSSNDAYTYALRVAFLAYLLQARTKRVQAAPPARPQSLNRASTSFHDLMKDFSLVRDSKSTRFPHGFVNELEKRLTGVLIGKEHRKEFQDATVKRTFGAFLNSLKEQSFKKRMEKDRRVEDLVLIFFSNATKELSKGKAPEDTSWKLMVDRHVALFVRLITFILKDHDWIKDRPELASRLATLEKSSQKNGPTVEVAAPLSYDVNDMPLVLTVAKAFGLRNSQVQSDINKNKDLWTGKEALQDLKLYQAHLNLNTGGTLSVADFEVEEGYEAWKKAEGPDLSQMMLAIIQSNPELAKSTGATLPQFNAQLADASFGEDMNSEPYPNASENSSYVIDQPVDMSSLSLEDENYEHPGTNLYTFIPPDPRSYYRFVLNQLLTHDLRDQSLEASEATSEMPASKLLSKQSTELLNEICLRWRIPNFTRLVLFLDVFREKYVDQEVSLDVLDSAFTFVKDPPATKNKRASIVMAPILYDRNKWTQADIFCMRRVIASIHEGLLRQLYETMMSCYEAKIPPIGPVMYLLENHVESDPYFVESVEEQERFCEYASNGLLEKAKAIYQEYLNKEIPPDQHEWEFHHVIQLGKAVMKVCQRIQKRYRKNPNILGINPITVLVNYILPVYAEDARDMIIRIIEQAQEKNELIEMQDGFDLYGELSSIRQTYIEALPGEPFPFHIEELLADFVWRWIQATDAKVNDWVNQAVKQDDFKVVDQIVQLNWDDDVGYAKFMTAISRSIGNGMARYCEILEGMFSREMDRLTPEQEAAARQTKQEKWMQMAKDAWTSKEKVEPFQFFPESFVKLNNIEYALQKFDQLERDINIDACAEVLAKNAPPLAKRQRKITNYVFTVKIVEAEDLKGCDLDGLSDPYVVLTDEYQKRISKSRIIYNNLNPRWDDTVDIMTKGPLNIIATIWDWDAMGDHDYVGRTSMKLDPVHFADFAPRDYWLDLDTQGRLLLRVSMEGERDDIQFYFGKAFRTLKRTEKDMTRKITEKLSAYINHCLSRRALKALLSRGISMSTVSSYFNRNRTQSNQAPTQAEVENALTPLFTYFDDNFSIMNQTLTGPAMRTVMARLWKEVLSTVESLLVPPLSDKPSNQKPLTQLELDIVQAWLGLLLAFFNAVDEETGEANGVPIDVLKSPKYHEIQTLFYFYFEPTEQLIRTSERMASATAARQQANRNRLSASSATLGVPGFAGVLSARRGKSILLSRNLGTMKKAKEEKRREAQAEPNDDMILRILRMRVEAAGYLRDRSRQKERLATAAAADLIVKQSLMAGTGGRMAGTLPRY